MGRTAHGSAFESRGRFFAVVTLGEKRRRGVLVPSATCLDDARARARLASAVVVSLRAAGRMEATNATIDAIAGLAPARMPPAEELVAALGAASQHGFVQTTIEQLSILPDESLEEVRRVVDRIVGGVWPGAPPGASSHASKGVGVTFDAFAQRWLSGELHRLHPDHVRAKRTADDDAGRYEKHIRAHVRDVPIARFALEHAEEVMRHLPAHLSRATRRQVAQLLGRILRLAVYPGRLIKASPIPSNWLPTVGAAKASPYLYPSEDRRLLGCTTVPLMARLLYGLMAREGFRRGEAVGLEWTDIDLEHGAVNLDHNKTDAPRTWALDPGVVRALTRWRKLRPTSRFVIELDDGARPDVRKLAEMLRDHLHVAGVDRSALYERSDTRRHVVAHSLRSTFVTLALAAGRSESWVADRTGHRSSQMINRYRKAARTHGELNLGELSPLDEAIPELYDEGRGAEGGPTGGADDSARGSVSNTSRDLPPEASKRTESCTKPKWRNWQTRRTQNEAVASREAPNGSEVQDAPDVSAPLEPPADALLTAYRALEEHLRHAIAERDVATMRRLRAAMDALLAPVVDATSSGVSEPGGARRR